MPEEACQSRGFFCCKIDNGKPKLSRTHIYYSQVQGQMAIGGRTWCDFIIYTEKGIIVERISFDELFWETELLPKLIQFCECCIAPEIVAPVHHFGRAIRDLRNNTPNVCSIIIVTVTIIIVETDYYYFCKLLLCTKLNNNFIYNKLHVL